MSPDTRSTMRMMTRRRMLREASLGFGAIAMTSLLADKGLAAAPGAGRPVVGQTHHRARASQRHGDRLQQLVGAVAQNDRELGRNPHRLAQHGLQLAGSRVGISVHGHLGEALPELFGERRREPVRIFHGV